MRVFLDTGVLVAAFATRGICADVMRLVLTEHEFVTGKPVFRELRRILIERLHLPTRVADQVIPFLREHGHVSDPRQPAPWPESDTHDRWILASALEANTDVLVTGEPTLLDVGEQASLHITDPRGFWKLIRHPLDDHGGEG